MGLIHVAVFGALISVSLGHHTLVVQSQNQDEINQIQKSIFTPEYNVNLRPYNEASKGVTQVEVQFKKIRFLEADETRARLTFQTTYRLKWVDPRLAYNSTLNITSIPIRECKGVMWVPDLYFENGLESEFAYMPHKTTRYTGISPNGGVFYSKLVTQTLFCPQLYNKEAKEILCQTDISSYGYYDDELAVYYNRDVAVVESQRDTESLQRFNYEGVTTADCRDQRSDAGHRYPCLNISFRFTRK